MMREDGIGLYIHIPFCARVCHFCAFVTQGHREDRAAAFVSDLLEEIRLLGHTSAQARPVETIYFGGGTPTTLSAEQLLGILDGCRKTWKVVPDSEISLEANPATVDSDSLATLRLGGINRISFGAQSFDDAELRAAGSPHTVAQIRLAMEQARDAGFSNVNLDLIYGLPGQSVRRWSLNLEAAVNLAPDHLSFYGLSIEEGSKFWRDADRGRLALDVEETFADMYEIGRAMLGSAGYRQYEVSNFARSGAACRHNVGYWTDQEWLGVGPGAHSYIGGVRSSNIESLEAYHRLVSQQTVPVADREPPIPNLRLREALAFGLRTVAGVRIGPLERRYMVALLEEFRAPIGRLVRAGLVIQEPNILRPTSVGLRFADEIAMAFL